MIHKNIADFYLEYKEGVDAVNTCIALHNYRECLKPKIYSQYYENSLIDYI